MHRKTLLTALHAYQCRWPDEPMAQQFIDFVERESACFERSTQAGHVTASAWIVNREQTQVLMLHHRKLGKWLQPGGHADGERDALAVARKEVAEEVGLTDLHAVNGIFDLDIHPIPARANEPEHLHYDVRFAFRPRNDQLAQRNHESTDMRWFDIGEVANWEEPSLARMARKWLALGA